MHPYMARYIYIKLVHLIPTASGISYFLKPFDSDLNHLKHGGRPSLPNMKILDLANLFVADAPIKR